MKNTVRLIFAVFIIFSETAPAMSHTLQRVFILHSYEANHVCGQPQHDGVIAAIKKAGFEEGRNLKIQVYHMDTKRKNNTPELVEKESRAALKKIREFKPDVLVTLDDNAFRAVALKLADSEVSVVFSGMNGQPEDYDQHKGFMNSRKTPGHNITGVYEKLHVVDAIRVHHRIFPDLQEVRLFSDQSPTGQAITRQLRLELENDSTIPCKWQIRVVKDLEEYIAEIQAVNNDLKVGAIYPAVLLLKDSKGTVYTAPEIFRKTVQISKKPEIALNYAFTRLGLFGGAAVDFYSMGQQAGHMVARILKGENPGNIAIEEATRYALAFNLKRASQLGIKIPDEFVQAADEVIKE